MPDRAFMERYYATYNRNEPEGMAEFYSDETVLAGQKGTAAILAGNRAIFEHFVDQLTPTRIVVDGDDAAVEITDTFTAKEDMADSFLGKSFTKGETFTMKLCAVYHFVDDKVREVTFYRGM